MKARKTENRGSSKALKMLAKCPTGIEGFDEIT